MAKATTTTVSDALQAAAEHHAAGQLDDAERLCDAVLTALPDHAEALHRRGILAFQRGALDHAADFVRRAIAVDENAPEPRNSLGNILLAGGNYADAVACYRDSLSVGPDAPVTLINLGIAHYGAGGRDDAKEALSDGLALMPEHAQARAALAVIALDEGEDGDAAAQLRAAALLQPRYGYGASCVLGEDLDAYTDVSGIDEMLTAAPALEGEMPAGAQPGPVSGPVVVTSCDHGYFRRYARPLAASLDANAPGHDLHIHVFNPEPDFDGELDALRTSLVNTTVTASREVAPGADAVYFSNMRFVRLHQIMQACGRGLVSLDADSLVRFPLGGLGGATGAALGAADLSVMLRPDRAEIGQKWLATTLVLRDTEAVRDYLSRVACYVLNCFHEDRLVWYLDQCVLYLVHRMMERAGVAPTLAPLAPGYADTTFAPESAIWAAKGDRKTAPAFVAEAASYAIPLARPGQAGRRTA
ncbi:MAG: tetratricopeptide repeat protein [Alphaproteobacteria bacterium]